MHAPLEASPFWENLYPNVKYAKRLAYMAMVSTIDSAVANISAALQRTGHWDTTLFIWASDNGTPVDVGGSNWPLKGGKGSNWEGGVRTPAFVNGGLLDDSLVGQSSTAHDATLCEGPFFILQRGRNLSGLVHICDLYSTFAATAGVDPFDGDWAPVDGVDQSAYIIHGTAQASPRTRIVHQHDMYSGAAVGAIRDGDWKLIVNEEGWADWYGGSSSGHFTPPEHGNTTNVHQCSVAAPCLFNIANVSVQWPSRASFATLPRCCCLRPACRTLWSTSTSHRQIRLRSPACCPFSTLMMTSTTRQSHRLL